VGWSPTSARRLGLAAPLAAMALAAPACGSDGAGSPDAGYECEETVADEGEPFVLRVGADDGGEFVEVQDGDEVTLVRGSQGLYMILLEARAVLDLPAASDTVCLTCSATMTSESGALDRAMPESGRTFYNVAGDDFESMVIIVLGDDLASYTDVDGSLSFQCAGHGLSSSVVRAIRLGAPQ